MRAPYRSPIRAQVLWISIKIEWGAEDRTGGGARIEKGRDRISDTRFPNERSCGTRRDRDEIKEKGFALMTVFHACSKNHPGYYSLSIYLSIYLSRSLLKLNRDDIRDEFRDQTRRNSNADPAPPTVLHCLRAIRVCIYVYSLSRLSYSLPRFDAEKRVQPRE